MKKYCFALDLTDNESLIAEYEQYHRNVPPAITENIRSAGITQMEIYRTGNRLFMVMETTDDFNPEQRASVDAENKQVQDWEQLMWKFQQPLPWAKKGEKWVEMKCIYQLQKPSS